MASLHPGSAALLAVLLFAITVLAQNQPPADPSAQAAADQPIEAARAAAAAFAQSLPDYIVKRTTTRYQGPRASVYPNDAAAWLQPDQAAGPWRILDTVRGDVAARQGSEIYSNITVNGRAAKNLPTGGVWSAGEFSIAMLAILAPESAARFTGQRAESIRNRPAFRYSYSIDHSHSKWRLTTANRVGATSGAPYSPAYAGAIWIDRATGQVLRIEMSARGLPDYYPMDTIESATDYDFVKIGDAAYCLPVHSEAFTCHRNTSSCLRNDTIFQDYNKFAANANITFDQPANDAATVPLRRELTHSMISPVFALTAAVMTMFASATADPVLEAARQAAADLAQSLPDYIETRTTIRTPGSRSTHNNYPPADVVWWDRKPSDTSAADIATVDGKENLPTF